MTSISAKIKTPNIDPFRHSVEIVDAKLFINGKAVPDGKMVDFVITEAGELRGVTEGPLLTTELKAGQILDLASQWMSIVDLGFFPLFEKDFPVVALEDGSQV